MRVSPILSLLGGFGTLAVGSVVPLDAQQAGAGIDPTPIFAAHCYSCHRGTSPAGKFDITNQSEILARIKIGDPDNSLLFQRVTLDTATLPRMPAGLAALSQEEIATLRQWIVKPPPAPDQSARAQASEATILAAIYADAAALRVSDPEGLPFARYFSLANLNNMPASRLSSEDLDKYRRSLFGLVNSLSNGPSLYKLRPVGERQLVYRVDLRALKWSPEIWLLIARSYPYGTVPLSGEPKQQAEAIIEATRCSVPWLRTDWFLANASAAPLYYQVLGLPKTLRELERDVIHVDVTKDAGAPGVNVIRAGFSNSGVSDHNRVVERHDSSTGYYWRSFDFLSSTGKADIHARPLDFEADGGEFIFSLPNHLQAYYITDKQGGRVDKADTAIVSGKGLRQATIRAGISCMGCHTEGIRTFKDSVREAHASGVDADRVQQLFVRQSLLDEKMGADQARFKAAQAELGKITFTKSAQGNVDPILGLVDAFQLDGVDLVQAAAELYMQPESLRAAISNNASLQAQGLGALLSGTLSRQTWEFHYTKVVEMLGAGRRIVFERYEEDYDLSFRAKKGDEFRYQLVGDVTETAKPNFPPFGGPPPQGGPGPDVQSKATGTLVMKVLQSEKSGYVLQVSIAGKDNQGKNVDSATNLDFDENGKLVNVSDGDPFALALFITPKLGKVAQGDRWSASYELGLGKRKSKFSAQYRVLDLEEKDGVPAVAISQSWNYTYSDDPDSGLSANGTIWIDQRTGVCVRVELTVKPFPEPDRKTKFGTLSIKLLASRIK